METKEINIYPITIGKKGIDNFFIKYGNGETVSWDWVDWYESLSEDEKENYLKETHRLIDVKKGSFDVKDTK